MPTEERCRGHEEGDPAVPWENPARRCEQEALALSSRSIIGPHLNTQVIMRGFSTSDTTTGKGDAEWRISTQHASEAILHRQAL
jgi:hypothetical protein